MAEFYQGDDHACKQGVDDTIGPLLDYLDKSGLASSTIVIYISDNGFFLGDLGMFDKRLMYVSGLRVPLIARRPGVIPAGKSCDEFALNIDIAPTFLELADIPAPADMQRRSLIHLLIGDKPDDWRNSIYYRYYHDPGDHNTRGDWKLIRLFYQGDNGAHSYQLYNKSSSHKFRLYGVPSSAVQKSDA